VEAFDYSLLRVFQPDVQFQMPMYQRPYVWSEEKQWAPLWDDIRGVAERYLAETARPTYEGEPTALERTPPHFLGAVVHGDGGSSHAAVTARVVIDGQQRLTTLQILLMVAREVASALGDQRSAARLRRLVENDDAVTDTSQDRWKVWPTNIDRIPFVATWTEGAADSRFADARAYFTKAIKDWAADTEADQTPVDRTAALAEVLQHRVHLVSIELHAADNAQAIFETLNDRGEALLAADLVKNYAFQQAQKGSVDLDDLYANTWEPFDRNKKWRKEVRQGRLRRPRIDVFLQHWLSLSLGRDAGSSDLFTAFKEMHREKAVPASDLLADLAHAAAVFDRIDAVAEQHPESLAGRFVHRWRAIEASTFTPALLTLFDDGVDDEQRNIGLAAIESFLVRRLLCQWTTKQYNLLAIDLAVQLRDCVPAERGVAAQAFLLSQTADSRKWPLDDEVRSALRTERAYRSIRADRLKMVFIAIENRLRERAGAEAFVPHDAKLEVEHLLPVSWKPYWRFPDGSTGTLEQQIERERALHRFGNLTVTTGAINKDLRNYPWTESEAVAFGLSEIEDYGKKKRSKRAALMTRSVLLLNVTFADAHPDRWAEDAIADRADELADEILELWSRPTSESTEQ
jgi:hypothetical protein